MLIPYFEEIKPTVMTSNDMEMRLLPELPSSVASAAGSGASQAEIGGNDGFDDRNEASEVGTASAARNNRSERPGSQTFSSCYLCGLQQSF